MQQFADEIRSILIRNPQAGWRTIARELKINPSGSLSRLIAKLKSGEPIPPARAKKSAKSSDNPTAEPQETREFAGNSGVIATRRYNIRTLDELLAYMEVDLEEWEVERHVINKWEVGAKDDADKIQVTPLYQVKAWLRRKKPQHEAEALRGLLTEFRKSAPKSKPLKYRRGEHLLEVDIFDPHFGKLCWAPETGQNYDLKLAAIGYEQAVDGLLARAKGFDIDRILFPLGNDFFHTDSSSPTTSAGTPQDVDGRWQKSWLAGRVAARNAILRLREVAPVDVVMVPGNHDHDRVFYLGDALEGWLSKTPGVTINNLPSLRKYFRYGGNLIGLTHGHAEKHANLPLIMATESAAAWAATKFREFHLGHWHSLKTIHFQPVTEFNGIRVRILSSLTPPDAWHKKMGYEGLRSANAFVWHKSEGCVAQFSFNA